MEGETSLPMVVAEEVGGAFERGGGGEGVGRRSSSPAVLQSSKMKQDSRTAGLLGLKFSVCYPLKTMKRYIPFLFALPLILGQGCAKPVIEPSGQETQPQVEQPAQAVTQQEPSPTPEATATNPITTNASQSSEPTSVNTPNRSNLSFPGVLPASETANKLIRIKTAKGDIVFELLPEEGPKAASNFAYLVKNNFYNGLTFHRREEGFVIQGGDPRGNGTGGPGYSFEDDAVKLPYSRGIVAMANAGPNTNGSQFFIMLGNAGLPPSYSVFGRVVQGMDVVDKIAVGDVMQSVTIENAK
jgi:cyclophilin family peptidyl-prolyl cis-trans isomerase